MKVSNHGLMGHEILCDRFSCEILKLINYSCNDDPNQIASIRSGAWILIPNEHTDQDTSDNSSKTDQDTDQET